MGLSIMCGFYYASKEFTYILSDSLASTQCYTFKFIHAPSEYVLSFDYRCLFHFINDPLIDYELTSSYLDHKIILFWIKWVRFFGSNDFIFWLNKHLLCLNSFQFGNFSRGISINIDLKLSHFDGFVVIMRM